MSHFTKLKTNIREKEILIRCLQEMGYRVEEGGTISGFENTRRVAIAIRMSEGYDMGFVRGAHGYYEIVADWWGVQKVSREQLTKQLDLLVRRHYAVRVTSEQLLKQGFSIMEHTQLKNGAVSIVARRWC